MLRALRRPVDRKTAPLLPGLTLIIGLAFLAAGFQFIEQQCFGYAILEGLVIALALGVTWRSIAGAQSTFEPGTRALSKPCLELAVVLLGATVNLPILLVGGPRLLAAVLGAAAAGVIAGYVFGRLLGLSSQLAMLLGVGNGICGNSAIAAVAPVIGAEEQDVASAVGLTAILGVVTISFLPLAAPLLGYSHYQYGVLAGMTVYAVPQVMAATLPVSTESGQVGTAVKLARVVLLGPLLLALGFAFRRDGAPAGSLPGKWVLPWFVPGFVCLALLRMSGILPEFAGEALLVIVRALLLAAMAAIGLSVDFRRARRVGFRVITAVSVSQVVLLVNNILLIRALGIGQ